MNRYGRTAQAYWETYLPTRVAAIPAPELEGFFAQLGREVEQAVLELAPTLAGPDPKAEDFLEKVGRLNNARIRAEESVMADLVYLTPESGTENREPPTTLPPGVHGA